MKNTLKTLAVGLTLLTFSPRLSAQKVDTVPVKMTPKKMSDVFINQVEDIEKSGGKMPRKSVQKTDTVPIKLTPQKPADQPDDLLRSIQRDLEKTKEAERNQPQPPKKMSDKVIDQLQEADKPADKPTQTTIIVRRELRLPIKPYHHELQLEAGAALNQLFRAFGLVKTADPYQASPYFVAYKYKFLKNTEGGGSVVRVGAGGFFDSQTTRLGGFADNKTTDSTAFNVRLGYELQRNIGDFWVVHFGIDALYGRNEKRITADSGFDKFIEKTAGTTSGFAFVGGIRWDFTAKASIGTEISLQFTSFNGAKDEVFTANPQFNRRVSDISRSRTQFIGPANVYLSIRF